MRLVAQIHDELIFEVDTSQLPVEQVAQVRMLAVPVCAAVSPSPYILKGQEWTPHRCPWKEWHLLGNGYLADAMPTQGALRTL